MKIEDIKRMAQAWNQVQEASHGKKKEAEIVKEDMKPEVKKALAKASASTEKGKKAVTLSKPPFKMDEKMDPVDAKELKGKHKNRKDKDIDNDGDTDSSDEYLHKRRKAISKSMKKDTETETLTQEEVELDEAPRRKGAPKITGDYVAIQRAKDAAHNAAMDRTKTGRKKPVRTMTSTQRSLASMRENDESVVEMTTAQKNKFDVLYKKMDGGPEHKALMSKFGNPVKANDAFHSLVMKKVMNEDLDEAWSDGVSSRNASKHAKDSAQYRKKADGFASKAKKHDKGSKEHSEHMADHHSATAKAIKSSYHSGQGGTVANAKRAHKSEMAKAKEFKTTNEGKIPPALQAYMDKKNGKKTPKKDEEVNEAATATHSPNNGSPSGEGLSPSAKKELARTTPMPDAVNEPMVDKKTFDAIRASGKKAPMRSNDNAAGDKTPPKSGK